MKKDRIKVFAMRCSENKVYKGRIEEIDNTLQAKRKFVGGTIQNVVIAGVDVICNDDGKLIGLPFNRAVIDNKGKLLDIFAGDILACNHDASGNYTDIKESDIPKLLEVLQPIAFITNKCVYCMNEEDLPKYEED